MCKGPAYYLVPFVHMKHKHRSLSNYNLLALLGHVFVRYGGSKMLLATCGSRSLAVSRVYVVPKAAAVSLWKGYSIGFSSPAVLKVPGPGPQVQVQGPSTKVRIPSSESPQSHGPRWQWTPWKYAWEKKKKWLIATVWDMNNTLYATPKPACVPVSLLGASPTEEWSSRT